MFETITGTDASGNNIVLDQFSVSGNAKRPNRLGDLAVSVKVTDKLRITDTFKAHSFDINGGNILNEILLRRRTTAGGTVELPPVFVDQFTYHIQDYRLYSNLFEIDYDFGPRFSAHIGHRYTDRHIERGVLVLPLDEATESQEYDNRTNPFVFGFKARPVRPWSIYFDLERGESDNVFSRVDNYNYNRFRLRNRITPSRNLSLNLSVITRDNSNPTMLEDQPPQDFGSDINTRIFTGSADWSPNSRFSLGTGYTYTHITSEAIIVAFVAGVRQQGLTRYFMRDHFWFLNTYLRPHPRVSFFGSYRIHRDTGQGDRVSPPPGIFLVSYPVQFQSPEVKLSFKLHDRVDWNLGYQYFDFKERFVNNQFYQAHLPYTSLRIYFNRR
jgi:hypothetical protein